MKFLILLEGIRTPFLDRLFSVITKFGEELAAVALICVIFWCINKTVAYKLGIVYFISALAVQGAKITFRIDRPWIIDPDFEPVPSALTTATGYSFPSGHTQGATALFGTLGILTKNIWARIACFAGVLAVAFSRMYLGVHTPADVFTALGFTLVTAIVVCCFYKGNTFLKQSAVLSIIVFVCSVGLLIYAFIMYRRGTIARDYVSDCCKAAGAGIGCSVGFFVETNFIRFSEKTKNIWLQILKCFLGIAGVVALRLGIKAVFGDSLTVDTIRYAVIIIWVLAIWPMFIKRFFSVKETPTVPED